MGSIIVIIRSTIPVASFSSVHDLDIDDAKVLLLLSCCVTSTCVSSSDEIKVTLPNSWVLLSFAEVELTKVSPWDGVLTSHGGVLLLLLSCFVTSLRPLLSYAEVGLTEVSPWDGVATSHGGVLLSCAQVGLTHHIIWVTLSALLKITTRQEERIVPFILPVILPISVS